MPSCSIALAFAIALMVGLVGYECGVRVGMRRIKYLAAKYDLAHYVTDANGKSLWRWKQKVLDFANNSHHGTDGE